MRDPGRIRERGRERDEDLGGVSRERERIVSNGLGRECSVLKRRFRLNLGSILQGFGLWYLGERQWFGRLASEESQRFRRLAIRFCSRAGYEPSFLIY